MVFAGFPAGFGPIWSGGLYMMWILLAALVGVVTLSVKEQLDRENHVACVNVLSREYSL